MTAQTKIDPSQLVDVAAKAVAALKQVTGEHEAERTAGTTIGTLQSITQLVEELTAQVVDLRRAATLRDAALRRIANLEVRSASELIEASRWKELTAELQSLAESALGTDRKRAPRDDA